MPVFIISIVVHLLLLIGRSQQLAINQVVGNDINTCVIFGGGASPSFVRCWGKANDTDTSKSILPNYVSNGQDLGDDEYVASQSIPNIDLKYKGMDEDPDVYSMCMGSSHACVVLVPPHSSDFVVVCWGDNSRGALGTSIVGSLLDLRGVADPTVPLQPSLFLFSLVCGRQHTCVLNTPKLGSFKSLVQCWGDNTKRQLGDSTLGDYSFYPSSIGSNLEQLSSSPYSDFTCGLANDGNVQVQCWGDDSSAQLGNSSLSSAIAGLPDRGLTVVSIGAVHACTIGSNHAVYCWGANAKFVITDTMPAETIFYSPVLVNFTQVNDSFALKVGPLNTCVLFNGIMMKCKGEGSLGVFPAIDANKTESLVWPFASNAPSVLFVDQSVITRDGICVVAPIGYLFCWGNSSSGRLARPFPQNSIIPVPTSANNASCLYAHYLFTDGIDRFEFLATTGQANVSISVSRNASCLLLPQLGHSFTIYPQMLGYPGEDLMDIIGYTYAGSGFTQQLELHDFRIAGTFNVTGTISADPVPYLKHNLISSLELSLTVLAGPPNNSRSIITPFAPVFFCSGSVIGTLLVSLQDSLGNPIVPISPADLDLQVTTNGTESIAVNAVSVVASGSNNTVVYGLSGFGSPSTSSLRLNAFSSVISDSSIIPQPVPFDPSWSVPTPISINTSAGVSFGSISFDFVYDSLASFSLVDICPFVEGCISARLVSTSTNHSLSISCQSNGTLVASGDSSLRKSGVYSILVSYDDTWKLVSGANIFVHPGPISSLSSRVAFDVDDRPLTLTIYSVEIFPADSYNNSIACSTGILAKITLTGGTLTASNCVDYPGTGESKVTIYFSVAIQGPLSIGVEFNGSSTVYASYTFTAAAAASASASGPSNSNRFGIGAIIGVAVGCFVAVTLAAILLIIGLKRRREARNKRLESNTKDDGLQMEPRRPRDLYITNVSIGKELGGGAFGTVYSATWQGVTVAIKTVNRQDDIDNLLAEATILQSLTHPNIVPFLGLYRHFEDNKLYIVYEYMSDGSLQQLLRNPSMAHYMSIEMLIKLARDVAAGMLQLEQQGILHCDLACRNLLVMRQGDGFLVKLTDFGLSRANVSREAGDVSTSWTGSILPVKWTAPEILKDRTFSPKGDIWSFGITFWEILSYAQEPYEGLTNQEAFNFILKGNRLTLPHYTPEPIAQLIHRCWDIDPKKRPRFGEIVECLTQYLNRSKEQQQVADDRDSSATASKTHFYSANLGSTENIYQQDLQ